MFCIGKNKVVVTGGAGFIGSHLTDALIVQGREVIIVDNLATGSEKNINKKAIFERIDITDKERLEGVFSRNKGEIGAVVHLAAYVNLVESMREPCIDAHNNIIGTLNVYTAAKDKGIPRFVFSSSAATYGIPTAFPVTEEHQQKPMSPYGLAKLTCESYLNLFREEKDGVRKVIFRFGNVYGPRQNREGKSEGGVVSIFLDRISRNLDVELRGKGEPVRDYIYVGDIVQALMMALEAPAGGIYNLGTTSGTTVSEVWKNILSASLEKVEYTGKAVMAPLGAGEIEKMVLSYGKVRAELGWEPKIPFSEGISRTVDDYFR